jgi:hypothetical protein
MSDWQARMAQWKETETYELMSATGLRFAGRVVRCLRSEFVSGRFDGSLDALEDAMMARLPVRNLGNEGQKLIALALIEWYKQKARGTDD